MAELTITKDQARRFLLTYHGLYGDYRFQGKDGILAFIRHVGCVQFDPLNVVGMNPELVLQARIPNFDRNMLWELLYQDRKLIDYWDKNMSFFPIEDWSSFHRVRQRHQGWCENNQAAVNRVHEEIVRRGPLCSGDLEYDDKVDWAWGPTRLSRAALEGMYHAGKLVIHHKTGTRKYYDLAERLIPHDLYAEQDPFESSESYYQWYVLRRIGSVGLLWNRPSDAWLGIPGLKSAERGTAFAQLFQQNKITAIQVEDFSSPFYIRTRDLDLLDQVLSNETTNERSSILAPLDNLMWDRNLIKELFDFEYRWEVYKPAAERKYGYYVLPVVYGDRIIARFEPLKQRRNEPLIIKNWWWEDQSKASSSMKESVIDCLHRFAAYLNAKDIEYTF